MHAHPDPNNRVIADVVDALVESGVILKSKIRNELMDVRPMLSPHFRDPPLLRMERGAMIKFGACVRACLCRSIAAAVLLCCCAAVLLCRRTSPSTNQPTHPQPGVPSHGVHINGFVRNPENPSDIKIWVRCLALPARRARSSRPPSALT